MAGSFNCICGNIDVVGGGGRGNSLRFQKRQNMWYFHASELLKIAFCHLYMLCKGFCHDFSTKKRVSTLDPEFNLLTIYGEFTLVPTLHRTRVQ